MRKLLPLLILWPSILLATCTTGSSGDCEVGSGKTYATISACASVVAAGQTCRVFAGTYNEVVTISTSGSSGNLITFKSNPGDTVNVYGFKLQGNFLVIGVVGAGFTITDPSLSHATYCIDTPNAQNHNRISGNTITQCGFGPGPGTGNSCIFTHGSGLVSFYEIDHNTISWCSAVSPAVSTNVGGTGVGTNGDHFYIHDNTLSHTLNGFSGTMTNSIHRGNTWGPVNDAVDFPNCNESGGCDSHADFFEISNPSSSTGQNVYEGNYEHDILGVGGAHFYIGDSQGNIVIDRFNTQYNVGSGYAGNGGNGSSGNIKNWKSYNNSVIVGCGQIACSVASWTAATNGAFINNLIYNYVNPAGTQNGYYNVDTPSQTGFVAANNLGFDSSCSPATSAHCMKAPISTATGTIYADPKLIATNGTNFGLQVSSPAINAATNLTTTTNSGVSSTTLTVSDATFFQDGYGITGVQPDQLRIGSSTVVAIAAGGINYSTNTITLASPATWSNSASVYLYSDSTGTQRLVDANGEIGAVPTSSPIAVFTPGTVNIGQVPVGLTSNPVSVTLQNGGGGTLTNTAITLSNSLFSIVSNTCGSPATITNLIPGTGFTLAAGASCTFSVTASPSAVGSATANAVFTENTAGGSDTLVLSATGTGSPATTPINFARGLTINIPCAVTVTAN